MNVSGQVYTHAALLWGNDKPAPTVCPRADLNLKVSVTCSKDFTVCPFREQDESSPFPAIQFLYDPF